MSTPIPLLVIVTQRNVFGTVKSVQNWKHDSDSYSNKLQSTAFDGRMRGPNTHLVMSYYLSKKDLIVAENGANSVSGSVVSK
jgi:hypothetical protein